MRAHFFAGGAFDRAAQLRGDARQLAGLLGGTSARIVPLHGSRNLLAGETTLTAALLSPAQLPELTLHEENLVFLGIYRQLHCFAVDASHLPEPTLAAHGRLADLRRSGPLLPAGDAALLAYARALLLWRQRHRYCGNCGAPTRSREAGHLLACSDPACGINQFPRLDPAIIVLVHDAARCLLGRQPSWPPSRYSTIAGFVEPGESLEEAVLREVYEETGVTATRPRYHSSQPWPFPSSLMLGFHAEVEEDSIRLLDGELEDARWFTRTELLTGEVTLPPQVSISFRLIEAWFDAGDQGALLERLPQAGLW
jgi:NAD+ diphosphatase